MKMLLSRKGFVTSWADVFKGLLFGILIGAGIIFYLAWQGLILK